MASKCDVCGRSGDYPMADGTVRCQTHASRVALGQRIAYLRAGLRKIAEHNWGDQCYPQAIARKVLNGDEPQ